MGQDSESFLPCVVDCISKRRIDLSGVKYLLVLSRAEPENNLSMIIDAYIDSLLSQEGVLLVLITNASSTLHGASLLDRYAHSEGVCFSEPQYDSRIVRVIRRQALGYVHGHSAGGTNPSLVEALAAKKPILAYDVSYNRHTTFDLATYFLNSDQLREAMLFLVREKLDILPELVSLSQAKYDWNSVSSDYYFLFSNICKLPLRGTSLLFGRFSLRIKRRIQRILVKASVRIRKSSLASSAKYESYIPRGR